MISPADIRAAAILIVDDQSVNVQLLDYLLTNTGYTNVSSTTDSRTVAALHAEHHYDLIILDLHMPHMNGFDVMEALRPMETDAWLPVLVVTAEPEKKVQALESGARDFVSKPFDPVEVLTRIRNMLEVRLLHRESRHYGTRLEQTVRERTAELQRFRSAMDATADAIFLIDADGQNLVDVNDGACRMLGYTRAELLTMAPLQLGLTDSEQPGSSELIEGSLLRADAVSVPVETYWQLQTLGETRVLIAVARDISERLLAQQRLRHMASYDRLTGLPNRTLFFQTLRES
ncbi:MAG: response regulator, partial [Massilia sp.]